MVIVQLSADELKNQIKAAVNEVLSDQLMIPQRDRLLSREEAATYLNVTVPTLNNWEKSGQLKPKRYGNRVYFFESDLLQKK